MNNKIEERFDPPFAVFENIVGNYIVRPLNWGGIWNPDGKLVGGNTMLNCDNEEDAKMIADTFNRFFELLKENKQLKSERNYLLDELEKYKNGGKDSE